MTMLIKKFNKGISIILKPVLISALIILSFQNSAIANEDKEKIVALTNWASIAYSHLFFNSYIGPASGFGYRYTCFTNPNVNCIGIKDGTNILDVRIDGQIISIGPVANTIAAMAASNNGILNVSGNSVNNGIIPAVFSPGKGEAVQSGGQINTVSWAVEASNESCLLSITVNTADPSTVVNLTISRVLVGSNSGFGQWTLSNPGDTAIPGITFDSASRTLTITGNLVLDRIEGGSDALTVSAGGTLKY